MRPILGATIVILFLASIPAFPAVAVGPIPQFRPCMTLPVSPFTTVCAGEVQNDSGGPCKGAQMDGFALHTFSADASAGPRRVGTFLYCFDLPNFNGPGTSLYTSVAIIGSISGEAPSPLVLWIDQGGVSFPGSAPYHFCYIALNQVPVFEVPSNSCPADQAPPHPPGA